MKNFVKGDLAFLGACFLWGASPTFTKVGLTDISPLYFGSFRFLIGGLLLAIIFAKKLPRLDGQVFRASCIAGVFLFLAFTFETLGVQYIQPMKSSLLISFNTMFIPIFCFFLFKQKLDVKVRVSMVFALTGLVLINYNGINFEFGLGDFLTILAAAFYSLHCIIIGEKVRKHDFSILVTLQLFIAGILSLIIALLYEQPVQSLSSASITALLMSGLFSTALSYILQAVGQKNINTVHAGIIVATIPLFGMLVSRLVLNNSLSTIAIIGSVFIVVSIINSNINVVGLIRGKLKSGDKDVAKAK